MEAPALNLGAFTLGTHRRDPHDRRERRRWPFVVGRLALGGLLPATRRRRCARGQTRRRPARPRRARRTSQRIARVERRNFTVAFRAELTAPLSLTPTVGAARATLSLEHVPLAWANSWLGPDAQLAPAEFSGAWQLNASPATREVQLTPTRPRRNRVAASRRAQTPCSACFRCALPKPASSPAKSPTPRTASPHRCVSNSCSTAINHRLPRGRTTASLGPLARRGQAAGRMVRNPVPANRDNPRRISRCAERNGHSRHLRDRRRADGRVRPVSSQPLKPGTRSPEALSFPESGQRCLAPRPLPSSRGRPAPAAVLCIG
jgi:hypothetical protein